MDLANLRDDAARRTFLRCLAWALITVVAGCGTTRMTDTKRTATEQLLISNAIDTSLDQMDLSALAGEDIYFEDKYLRNTTDDDYTISSIRQKLLASGCTLKDKPSEARYIVEARSGGVGTDSHNVVVGVPAIQVPPALAALGGSPSIPTIPEVPMVKKASQRGVAKLALFAYDREKGTAYLQSGSRPSESTASDIWVLGAGPFQWGSIYKRLRFAGGQVPLPVRGGEDGQELHRVTPGEDDVEITEVALFEHRETTDDVAPPSQLAGETSESQTAAGSVELAGFEQRKSD